jgi:hypothetical protein
LESRFHPLACRFCAQLFKWQALISAKLESWHFIFSPAARPHTEPANNMPEWPE